MATSYIWHRGFRMTPAVRDALLAAEQRAGFAFTVTQGGFNAGGVKASAGTHDGDALDLSIRGLTRQQVGRMVEAMRWAGFAAWFRTTGVAKWGVRAQGFGSYHVHAVPNGWGSPSAGARRQAEAYRDGRDGLARNLADIGPGHVATYRTKTRPEQPTEPTSTPTPEEPDMKLDDIVPSTGGLTVAQCLARGAWAYAQIIDGGKIANRATANTDARAQWAYASVIRGGSLESRVAELERRLEQP